MNSLFLLVLSLSISGSLVVLTFALLKPLLNCFSKTWQYYAWLLVILRLLVPFSPDVSLVGSLFDQIETQINSLNKTEVQKLVGNVPGAVWNLTSESASEGFDINAFTSNDQDGNAAESVIAEDRQVHSWVTESVVGILRVHIWGIIWGAVAAILLIRKLIAYCCFSNAVQKESKQVTEGQVSILLDNMRAKMGIKKKVSVCTNYMIKAPMLVGVIKPKIIIPTEEIPGVELMFIFRHELTHYQRRDFLYKWLMEIALCVHWFNPLIYQVHKKMNQDCEFSCDEAVISCIEITERQDYGETLINSIVISDTGRNGHISLSLNEDIKLIKERLDKIMHYHRKSKIIVATAAVIMSALFCGTVFAGAYTAEAVGQVMTQLPQIMSSPVQLKKEPVIRINTSELASKGKISLGKQELDAGVYGKIALTWSGKEKLTVSCVSENGLEKKYTITSGMTKSFEIKEKGSYTVAVHNRSAHTVYDVKGTITFSKAANDTRTAPTSDKKKSSVQSVVYEKVEMIYPNNREEGFPYIHDVWTNNSDKTIIKKEQAMLAFDKNGKPLKINWFSTDSESEPSYDYLYTWGSYKVKAGRTEDLDGGWTLDIYGTDKNVNKIAYVLYCDKKITFSDGTVWKNQEYQQWLKDYKGKDVSTDVLKNYYPFVQTME